MSIYKFSLLALATAASWSVAAHDASAQSQCTSMTNDIARLQCYDEHFASKSSANNMSVNDAYKEFLELAQNDHIIVGEDDQLLTYDLDGCAMTVTYGESGIRFADLAVAYTVYRWKIALTDIESIDYARLSNTELEIRMQPESLIFYDVIEGSSDAKHFVINGHWGLGLLREAGPNSRDLQHLEKRVRDVTMALDEENIPEVRARFEALVSACHNDTSSS